MYSPRVEFGRARISRVSTQLNGHILTQANSSVRYFKWGIARIVLETTSISGEQPIIVPMFIEGLDQVMHESRTFPRFLPRVGKSVKCTYGEPIDEQIIQPYIDRWRDLCTQSYKARDANSGSGVPEDLLDGKVAQEIRRELTKVIRDAVVTLRAEAGYPPEHPMAHHAEFYDSSEGLKYDELSGIPRPEIFRKKLPRQQEVYEKETSN